MKIAPVFYSNSASKQEFLKRLDRANWSLWSKIYPGDVGFNGPGIQPKSLPETPYFFDSFGDFKSKKPQRYIVAKSCDQQYLLGDLTKMKIFILPFVKE